MTTPQAASATPSPEPGPGADGATILLPLVPQPSAPPATGPQARHGGDRVLSLLVLVLAFLTASFLARNSDLWFHLATGRLLAQGQFAFGSDPFAYTTRGVYWACHSWLFDLGLYGLYGLVGGTGLVITKALLVAALAAVLLRVRRPGTGAWLPAVGTALAVVAMSPRLLLQPACASYLLLGLTFWLLWRGQEKADRPGWFPHLLLPPLFALWVNVDEWFLLGPLLTALFWLGERLWGQRRTPNWVLLAGMAACLLNPYMYHALTLPSELSPVTWTSGLRDDGRFQVLFAPSWSPAYLTTPGPHAVLAYFALAALGLLSFLLHRPALRDWRLVVWLPFAALAAGQARAVPFFAVVAAPITVLNWQDFLAARAEAVSRIPGVAVAPSLGRLLLGAALLALLGLAWVGWLAGAGREARHVAWGVQPDPSLRRAAEALHEWRQRGLLAEGQHVFAVTPEAAHYGAWFAPGERFFFDHRYQLFPQAARDYVTVCRGLLPGRDDSSGEEWQRVLRENGVAVVLFSAHDPQRLFPVLQRAAAEPGAWTLLDVAGQALLVRWAGGAAPPAFDADRLAFGPQDEGTRLALPAAPEQAPEQLSPPHDWRERLTRLPPPPSWESPAASMYLFYAEQSKAALSQRQQQAAMSGFAASLAGLPALPAGLHQAALQLVSSRNLLFLPKGASLYLVRDQLGPFFVHLTEREPALALLAVRAARRAVATNPEDANAWFCLGQAYVTLRNDTWERSAEWLLPPLADLRHVQVATALEQAVRLNPDLEEAHRQLHDLYGAGNFLDQALEHRREQVRLRRQSGPWPGQSAEEWLDDLDALERDTAKLVELVADRRKKYAAASRAVQDDRFEQARLALRLGLVRVAVEDVLLKAPVDLLGAQGIRLELDLLLHLGRAEDVRAILADEKLRASREGLGYHDLPFPKDPSGGPLYAIPYHWPTYEWLHAVESAAVGDYALAREEVASLRAGRKAGLELLARQRPDYDKGLYLFVPGLLSGPLPWLRAFTAHNLGGYVEKWAAIRAGEPALRAQQADLLVLEAMVALEQGDPDAARSAFAEAEALCAPPAGAPVPFAGAPIAARYLGKLNARR
jgi:hypothetical protein